jgi:hypothetical protein
MLCAVESPARRKLGASQLRVEHFDRQLTAIVGRESV